MLKNPLKIKIAYLYPDFMQGLCDKANLDIFKFRAKERNIDVEIEEIKNDNKINSSKYDFYYISGSNLESVISCMKHARNNISQLKVASDADIPMLAINCGYILFGKSFQLENTPMYNGIGILNVTSGMSQKHIYSKVKGTCSLVNDTIVGFQNHLTETKMLDDSIRPFLSLSKDKTEGALYKNVIGTYITSPILAQNPVLCDYIISNCLEVRYKCRIPLTKLTDDIEWYSHNYLLEAK